jgi:hypothetical protein
VVGSIVNSQYSDSAFALTSTLKHLKVVSGRRGFATPPGGKKPAFGKLLGVTGYCREVSAKVHLIVVYSGACNSCQKIKEARRGDSNSLHA